MCQQRSADRFCHTLEVLNTMCLVVPGNLGGQFVAKPITANAAGRNKGPFLPGLVVNFYLAMRRVFDCVLNDSSFRELVTPILEIRLPTILVYQNSNATFFNGVLGTTTRDSG